MLLNNFNLSTLNVFNKILKCAEMFLYFYNTINFSLDNNVEIIWTFD